MLLPHENEIKLPFSLCVYFIDALKIGDADIIVLKDGQHSQT